jgi:hypothetical protein
VIGEYVTEFAGDGDEDREVLEERDMSEKKRRMVVEFWNQVNERKAIDLSSCSG